MSTPAERRPCSLHGVFWDAGKYKGDGEGGADPNGPDLLTAIRECWYAAMATNPGFLGGVVMAPAPGAERAEGYAAPYDLSHSFETVSWWRTEADRLAWAATPPHDTEFPKVISRVHRR